MKKKLEDLTEFERKTILMNKRIMVVRNYKKHMIEEGLEKSINKSMIATLFRMTQLTEEDLEDDKLTKGVFDRRKHQ